MSVKEPVNVLSVCFSLDHIYPVGGFRSMGEDKREDSQFVPVTLVYLITYPLQVFCIVQSSRSSN